MKKKLFVFFKKLVFRVWSRLKGNIFVTWNKYCELVESLAVLIRDSNFRPTCIVSIPRGGNFIADTLSRLFGVPIVYLPATGYDDDTDTAFQKVIFSREFARTFTDDSLYLERPLIVDDLTETGRTLYWAEKNIKNRFGKIVKEVKKAVIWVKVEEKSDPVIEVDFWVQKVPKKQSWSRTILRKGRNRWPWIIQPFELYGKHKIRLEDL